MAYAYGHLANYVLGGRKQPFGLHAKKMSYMAYENDPSIYTQGIFFFYLKKVLKRLFVCYCNFDTEFVSKQQGYRGQD